LENHFTESTDNHFYKKNYLARLSLESIENHLEALTNGVSIHSLWVQTGVVHIRPHRIFQVGGLDISSFNNKERCEKSSNFLRYYFTTSQGRVVQILPKPKPRNSQGPTIPY